MRQKILFALSIVLLGCVILSTRFYEIDVPLWHFFGGGRRLDPASLHLSGEFVESNLGTAIEPDGSATVRMLAEQYDFVPHCVRVPAQTPVKFRLTSADVIHGFLLPDTNVNTMVVPGFVAEVRTSFSEPRSYRMACNEFCGLGHHGMWTRVIVVPKDRFPAQGPLERTSCGTR
jgi:cytochrome c oxidase subunit 2